MLSKIGKKWIWILGGVVLLVGMIAVFQVRDGDVAAAAPTNETAVAFVGDLAESVSASGQVVAISDAGLSLTAAGTVDQVNVAVGDNVHAGDLLVQLDTAALERKLASAELDVTIAQADLADLLADPTAVEIAAAKASVRSAQARLGDLLAGADEEEIAASEATVRAAGARVNSAKADFIETYDVSDADIMAAEADLATAMEQQEAAHNMWVLLADCEDNGVGEHSCTPTDSDRMETATQNVQSANAQVAIAQARLDELSRPEASRVASAQANVDAAVAQYDAAVARHEGLLLGASDADVAAAEAELANAQASLESLLAGPSDTNVDMYRIRLAQAKTALQQAHNRLADATMVAPFDGTITAVHISEDEQASGLALELVDDSSLEVLLNVDEVDLGRIAVGQPAVVTLETWPGVEIDAVITAIAPRASGSSTGVVSYQVRLELSETGLPVLVGMTANADLVTDRQEGVLLVPNAAITADREAGTYTVNRVHIDRDGTRTISTIEVTVGLKDGDHAQIIDGLVKGDVVLLGQLSAPTQQDFSPGQGEIVR